MRHPKVGFEYDGLTGFWCLQCFPLVNGVFSDVALWLPCIGERFTSRLVVLPTDEVFGGVLVNNRPDLVVSFVVKDPVWMRLACE